MNRKHTDILKTVFDKPERSDIVWKDIESLFKALGAEVTGITEGKGSRIRIYLNSVRAVFHRPHPKKETDKGAVKSVRRFLMEEELLKMEYKGYRAKVEFDDEFELFHGEVIDTRDVITFQGGSVRELKKEFKQLAIGSIGIGGISESVKCLGSSEL